MARRGWARPGMAWQGEARQGKPFGALERDQQMKIAEVQLKSASPYSQSRHYVDDVPKKPKETANDYEERTWMHRLHTTKDGLVEIPGGAFANAVKGAAKRLKLQVPGKGRVEYTKYFEAGVMVPDGLILPIKAASVPCDKLFVPSDGRRGGGKRVTKFFPRIDAWEGTVRFFIFDDLITEDVFLQVLRASGVLVGIGRFRPESCGFYGRFSVEAHKWIDDADSMFAAAE